MMHTGMLWFDNSGISFSKKVEKAFDYYKRRYGRTPDLCLAHPSMLENKSMHEITIKKNQIIVRAYRPVLPGHIWVGIGDPDTMEKFRNQLQKG